MATINTYPINDVYLVRVGEIAVEFHGYCTDGYPAPSEFARFRSFSRAQDFANTKRAAGCHVKAWRALSDDQSELVRL